MKNLVDVIFPWSYALSILHLGRVDYGEGSKLARIGQVRSHFMIDNTMVDL